MVACSNSQCPIKNKCQKHKKNSTDSKLFTKYYFVFNNGKPHCDEFVCKQETAPRLKKDGTPKKSGGLRSNPGGRPKKQNIPITKEQTILSLKELGYFAIDLWNVSDVVEIANDMGMTFDSIEDAKKVASMVEKKYSGENFDMEYPVCRHNIIFEIQSFFEDPNPFHELWLAQ